MGLSLKTLGTELINDEPDSGKDNVQAAKRDSEEKKQSYNW